MIKLLAILISCSFLLSGCLTQDYFTVGGMTYYSKNEAINKLDQMNSMDLEGIVPISNPIEASALVTINAMERMEDTAIVYNPNKESTKRIYIDYLSEFWFKTFKMNYEALQKRNLFSKVKFSSDIYPENVKNNDFDYIIYLYNPSPNLAQWFIKGKTLTEPQLVNTDMSKPGGPQRLMSWIDSIEKTVRGNSTASPSPSPSVTDRNKRQPSYGTGFAVAKNGTIVTAYHVVSGHENISVKFENGEWLPARLIKYSKSNDIAILAIDKNVNEYLKLTDTKKLKQADRVFTMGYPATNVLGTEPKYTEGYVSSLSGIQDEDSLMQVSVPIQPGNSGGPLVNSKGDVVGLITSTAAVNAFYKFTGSLPQNINWAVKSDYIQLLIDSEVLDKNKDTDDAVASTKKSICLVRSE